MIFVGNIPFECNYIPNFQATAIFKAFYDHDIIEEEVILDWGKKVSKKYVSKALSEKIHEKVKPFLTWLKEAEEDSSDEESDDGVQLEFDERVHASGIKEKVNKWLLLNKYPFINFLICFMPCLHHVTQIRQIFYRKRNRSIMEKLRIRKKKLLQMVTKRMMTMT